MCRGQILKLTLVTAPAIVREMKGKYFFIALHASFTKYIEENCDHVLVHDLIDIDPDRSKSICYCEKCMTTFPNAN